jgi:hypothetical protein
MRLFVISVSLLLSFIYPTSLLMSADLMVVKTTPENGKGKVDPSLREISIVFSGAVKQNSWSFVATDGGEFPESAGDPYFKDNKTCVLPVKLKPGMTYSMGINSALKKGFKSATDEKIAAIPYVLTFSTGQSVGKQEQGKGLKTESQEPETKGPKGTVIFQRVTEPNERAFNLLIPKGWQVEGGILRVNPMAQGGPAQSIAAKLDFAVKKNPGGTMMIRWLPDMLYYDARMSPAGQMGLFPPGSNYQGMTVSPLMSALQFLSQVVFRFSHPQANGVRAVEQRSLPQMAQRYRQRVLAFMPQATFSYDAGILTAVYQEGGISYKEKLMAVIENWGAMGAGMWGNKETFFLRAPASEFDEWAPIFSVIQSSVILNAQWIAGELQGQAQRGQIALNTQREIQRIDQEIVEHRRKTNAEIHNDMFLTLTSQEEYVNPHTRQIEVGSNQWKYRWVNESGEVVYSNDQNYDPNHDIRLNRSDFKKTPVRPRFPQ